MLLQQALSAHGFHGQVHLLGPHIDQPPLTAALDALASTSSAEIETNTERVVAAGDMQGNARGVLELLEMPIQQKQGLGHAAREHIQNQYDIVSVINRYQDFYERLITEQRKD